MALNVGKLAEEINNAFEARWKVYAKVDEMPEQGYPERLLLFSAIAEGILKHLQDELPKSITMTVTVTQHEVGTTASPILSKNQQEVDVRVRYNSVGMAEYYLDPGDITVSQTSDLIDSSGEPRIEEVVVEGLL